MKKNSAKYIWMQSALSLSLATQDKNIKQVNKPYLFHKNTPEFFLYSPKYPPYFYFISTTIPSHFSLSSLFLSLSRDPLTPLPTPWMHVELRRKMNWEWWADEFHSKWSHLNIVLSTALVFIRLIDLVATLSNRLNFDLITNFSFYPVDQLTCYLIDHISFKPAKGFMFLPNSIVFAWFNI